MRQRGAAGGALAARFRQLMPVTGPWVSAGLWAELTDVAPPQVDVVPELAQIAANNLAPAVLRYARQSNASLDNDVRAELERQKFELSVRSSKAVREVTAVISLLRDAGIAATVIKGPGIAAHYPSATLRPYSDIDLLVPPADFRRALTSLKANRWYEEARNRQPWPYFDRFCREAVNLKNPTDGSVDLHHHVSPWIWAAPLRPEAVYTRSEIREVGAWQLRCADAIDNLAIACLHLINEHHAPGGKLSVWRDVAVLGRAVDPQLASTRLRSLGLAGYVRRILECLPASVVPTALKETLPADPIPHPRRLKHVLSPHEQRPSVVDVHLLRLPLANASLYLAGTILPSKVVAQREFPGGHSYRRYWSHAIYERSGRLGGIK